MEAALPKFFLALFCIQRRIVQRCVLPLLLPPPTNQTSLPWASLLTWPRTFTRLSSCAFLPRAEPPLYLFLRMSYHSTTFEEMIPVALLKGKEICVFWESADMVTCHYARSLLTGAGRCLSLLEVLLIVLFLCCFLRVCVWGKSKAVFSNGWNCLMSSSSFLCLVLTRCGFLINNE